MELVRLNKYLKDQGLCSRRRADEYILQGLIKVNGVIVCELGYKVNPKLDRVEILKEAYCLEESYSYILLNKPNNYVCSTSLTEGKTIFELVPKIKGLTYAGRLDKDSHGLVILSNDGRFNYRVFGAEFNREKEYIVRVDKPVTQDFLNTLANEVIILDGKKLKAAKVRPLGTHVYVIILTEGLNRQIRRMAEVCGYRVLDLKRIRIDNITDKNLTTGKWRNLTKEEVGGILTS